MPFFMWLNPYILLFGLGLRLAGASGDDHGDDHGEDDHDTDHGGENAHIIDSIMCMFLASLLCMVVTSWLFTQTQCTKRCRKRFPVPYTLAIFWVGFILAILFDEEPDDAHDDGEVFVRLHAFGHHAFRQTQSMNPHIIILVILPPLIYESASDMNYHVFKKIMLQAGILAFPGMIMSLLLTGMWCKITFGHKWSMPISFLLGAIVSATDPVAVVGALHELGAPAKLASLIDGESLLNDGSAMVAFFVFLALATGEEFTIGDGLLLSLRLALGGLAWGWFTYQLASTTIHHTVDDWKIEVSTIVLGVYGTFVLAEVSLGVSGIISVVMFGIYMSRRGKYAISPHAEPVLHHIMSGLAAFSETAIFFLAGVVSWNACKEAKPGRKEWLNLIGLYVILHFIRAFVILFWLKPMNLFGGAAYKLSLKECFIMTWGGLRGAVGLALGMIVVEHVEHTDGGSLDVEGAHLVNFYVTGIVILTMSINGISCIMVYHQLKIYETNPFRQKMVSKVTRDIEKKMDEHMRSAEFKGDWMYGKADLVAIKELLLDFSGVQVNDNNELEGLPQMPNVYSLIIGEFTWTSLLPTLMPTVVADEPSGSPDSGMSAQRDDVTDRQVTSAANEAILDKESELKESEIADTAFAYLRECYLTEYEDKSMDDDAVYVAMEALESAVDSMAKPTGGAASKSTTMAAAFVYELKRLGEVLPYKQLREARVKMQGVYILGIYARYYVFKDSYLIFEVLNGFIRAHEDLLAQMKKDGRVTNADALLTLPIELARAQYTHWSKEFPTVARIHRMIVTTRRLLVEKEEIIARMHKSGLLISGDVENMRACLKQVFAMVQALRFSFVVSNNHGKPWGRVRKNAAGDFEIVTPRPFEGENEAASAGTGEKTRVRTESTAKIAPEEVVQPV